MAERSEAQLRLKISRSLIFELLASLHSAIFSEISANNQLVTIAARVKKFVSVQLNGIAF